MDPNLIAIFARSLERIVAVLLGGLAVYYGYRLFLVVPVETHSDGKILLPGLSVTLVKAGPGLFFAAFGAIVVITSLMRPIKVTPEESYQGVTDTVAPRAETRRTEPQTQRPGTEQDLARVRLTLQTLNCMQRLSMAGPKALPADAEVAVRDAKLALLESVWMTGDWGDFESFKRWASGGAAGTSSPAKALFEAERADCPH